MTGHELLFDGRPCRVVMAIDVSERRRLEERLRLAQRMEAVGQLAGGIAHDFNNLLMVINGFSELLVARLPPGDELEAAQQIRTAGDRAAALTKQLLAFGRPSIVRPETLNLAELIGGLLPMSSARSACRSRSRSARPPARHGSRRIAHSSSRCWSTSRSTPATPCPTAGGCGSSSRTPAATTRGDGIRARDAAAQRQRHRQRHRRGDPRAGLPAVLHDEGRPREQRTRAGDGLRDRARVRRTDLGRRRATPGRRSACCCRGPRRPVRSPRRAGADRAPSDRRRSSSSRTNPRS